MADGWCSGDAIATAERYDPCRRMWALVASKCKERCGVGVGVIDDLPYTVGRHIGQIYLNSMEVSIRVGVVRRRRPQIFPTY